MPKTATPIKAECGNFDSLRRDGSRRLMLQGHMSRLVRHACEPGADRGKCREIVVAQMRHVRVGVKRDVGDRVAVGGKEVVHGKMLLHDAERTMAFFHPVLESVLLQVASALDQRQPE